MTKHEAKESTSISPSAVEDRPRCDYFLVPEARIKGMVAYRLGVSSIDALRDPDPYLVMNSKPVVLGEEVVSGMPYKTRIYEEKEADVAAHNGPRSSRVTFFKPDTRRIWEASFMPQRLTTSRLEISALDDRGIPIALRQEHFMIAEGPMEDNINYEEGAFDWVEDSYYVVIRDGEFFWIDGDIDNDFGGDIRDINELSTRERDRIAKPFLPRKMPDEDPRDPE